MKNLHVIATDKTSKLQLNVNTKKLILFDNIQSNNESVHLTTQHIYITSDEEIKEGIDQWYLDTFLNKPRNSSGSQYAEKQDVIILTTDQDLINDGVQAIDDEFLEWFVKNPSCENVEVKPLLSNNGRALFGYKTIIQKEEQCTCKEHDPYCCQIHGNCPTCVKEEPKQETLEEGYERIYDSMDYVGDFDFTSFKLGAKWQQERMYSEEEVNKMFDTLKRNSIDNVATISNVDLFISSWVKQFKKK